MVENWEGFVFQSDGNNGYTTDADCNGQKTVQSHWLYFVHNRISCYGNCISNHYHNKH